MNRLLASQKMLEIEKHLYQSEQEAFWSFSIRYIQSNTANFQNNNNKNKIDYKEVLTESEFNIFSKLRECRKKVASNDAVPAYAVFTDEELAGIAKLPNIEVNTLNLVKGIGDKKVDKYGKQILELYYSKTELNEKGQ